MARPLAPLSSTCKPPAARNFAATHSAFQVAAGSIKEIIVCSKRKDSDYSEDLCAVLTVRAYLDLD